MGGSKEFKRPLIREVDCTKDDVGIRTDVWRKVSAEGHLSNQINFSIMKRCSLLYPPGWTLHVGWRIGNRGGTPRLCFKMCLESR